MEAAMPYLSHQQYKHWVKKSLIHFYLKGKIKSITELTREIAAMFNLNLTPVRELTKPLYKKPRGSKPKDPAAMLRALILMTFTKEPSITNWANTLKKSDHLAVLAGFEPGKTPGVGTFYDFIDRLNHINKELKRKQKNKLRKPKRKPQKNKNQDKPPHPDIVKKMVKRVLRYLNHLPYLGSGETLYRIFAQCFVQNSAKLDLLGDTTNLNISGDGTKIKTGASPYGTKLCDCKKQKIYNCQCPRKYTDQKAQWGWDSYREIYIYGYGFYEINAADSPHDLPIFFLQTDCQRHDSVPSVVGLDHARKLFPNFTFKTFIADSAHDNYPFYKLLNQWHIEPFIVLNPKNTGNLTYENFSINDQGHPICSGGFEMKHDGYCDDRMRIKWRCPLKAQKHFPNNYVCTALNYCSPSLYGRTVYTYPEQNLRLFTKTPRGSTEWKNTFNKRSGSERTFKRKKTDYNIEAVRVRSHTHWFTRYALTAMCQHIDAWIANDKTNFKELCKSWQSEKLKN